MRHIGSSEVLSLLQRVVEAKGFGYVYGATGTDTAGMACMNWIDLGENEPRQAMCIAGRVYDLLGVLDHVGGSSTVIDVAKSLEDQRILTFTPAAKLALRTAQIMQDQKYGWGVSLEAARAAVQAYRQVTS